MIINENGKGLKTVYLKESKNYIVGIHGIITNSDKDSGISIRAGKALYIIPSNNVAYIEKLNFYNED